MQQTQEYYMRLALREAAKAAAIDEVPVGAVIVREGSVIARAHNKREAGKNPCAHAELLAIQKARLDEVYFGAPDPKAGCFGSLCDLNALPFNHHPLVSGGILQEECAQILREYFREKRKKKKE